MKNRQLSILHKGLTDSGKLQGVKFAYAVAKNKKLIEEEVEALNEGLNPSEKFKEYDEKRVELAKEHAEKDEDGNAVMVGEENIKSFDIKDIAKFTKDLEKIQEEYKTELEARDKQLKDYEKLMDEDTKLELQKVKLENVPEEITGEQLELISEIIEE